MSEVVKVINNTSDSNTEPLPEIPAEAGAVVAEAGAVVADVADTVATFEKSAVVDEAPKVEKKPVAFLMDIESKAIVESLGDLEDFSVSNLMKVLPKLMTHVENYKNLRGSQKRELVIKMVRHIIDITDGPGNDEVWDPILKQLVPGLIDTLVEVNDGKLKIRKRKLGFLKAFCCTGRPKVQE